MFTIYTIALIALVSITLVHASCCYSFSYQPLSPTSPYYTLNSNGPSSYSLSLTASSQSAVNSPGEAYLALVTFPANFVISAIPAGCISASINSVSCTSSGTSQLLANFGNVFNAEGTGAAISLESVVVNGEQCVCQPSCPVLTPPAISSSSISTSTSLARTSNSPTITAFTSTTNISGGTPTSTSCSSCSPPCSTSTMSSGSTLSNDSSKVNKGLAVGLALTMTLLVFLVIICILHLRRKGSPFFFGINRKGSRISLSRGVSGSHDAGIGQAVDINKIESGLDHASEPNATVAVEKLSEREATSAQVLSQEPIKSVSGESTGITTTRAADVPSHQAPTAPSTIVMTLVDIPEFQQSEANNLEDENGGRMLESENRHGTGQYSIHAASGTTDQQPLQQIPPEPSVINSDKTPLVTEVGSKSSRFHRAVSAASKKLGFQSNNSPQFSTQEHNHKHQVQQVESSVSKFLRNSFLFRSNSRARSSSNRGVVTTIRPEHHQQQIRQIQLDQGIDFEAQEHQQINPNNTNALDGKQNKKPSTFGKHSGIGLISNKEAFTNPGPPPLPPSAQLLFDSYMPTGSGKGKPKRGYKQPIHIKPQRQRAPSTPQEQAAKSDAHNPGLYGYM